MNIEIVAQYQCDMILQVSSLIAKGNYSIISQIRNVMCKNTHNVQKLWVDIDDDVSVTHLFTQFPNFL